MAAGSLQTCSGTESGIEAAIHGMKAIFEDEDCEAVLLINAKNAFRIRIRIRIIILTVLIER